MNDYTNIRLKTKQTLFRQNNLKSPKTSREQVVPTAEKVLICLCFNAKIPDCYRSRPSENTSEYATNKPAVYSSLTTPVNLKLPIEG
jgi:hypothetical protein